VSAHTSTADALRFGQRASEACSEILADAEPVAAILHGSLAFGDFVPGRSDIDLLVVVGRKLTGEQADALIVMARRETRSGQALDLRVVTRSVASWPTPSPPMELWFGHHVGDHDDVERDVMTEPDLLVEFRIARGGGRSLVGPDPRDVIGPIPESWIHEYGRQLLVGWEGLTDDAQHAELMVLTACRIWRSRRPCGSPRRTLPPPGHWSVIRH
jgi:hypothetical protein